VLGTRPRQVREGGHFELFGDYDFEEKRIRIWMRTAVLGKGDVVSWPPSHAAARVSVITSIARVSASWRRRNTRGFHARVDDLYHQALATPPERRRPLVWDPHGQRLAPRLVEAAVRPDRGRKKGELTAEPGKD